MHSWFNASEIMPATQALMWVGFAYAAGSWFAWRAEETGSATI